MVGMTLHWSGEAIAKVMHACVYLCVSSLHCLCTEGHSNIFIFKVEGGRGLELTVCSNTRKVLMCL